MFSIDDVASLKEVIEDWVVDYVEQAKSVNLVDVVYYLVGLKADLENKRQVDKCEASSIAGALNMRYFEVSALNTTNVELLTKTLCNDLLAAQWYVSITKI